MAKARSPHYPSIGLKEAIDKITAVYQQDYQNAIPRDVVAAHMGYQSLNGKSLGVLSAVGKFGLIEGRGDQYRVSDLAVAIIAHAPGTPERAKAIREAASRPELFIEIDQRFRGGKTSDQAIRSYLLVQKFIPAAADTVIRSYRETRQLAEAEASGYNSEVDSDTEHPMPPTPPPQTSVHMSSPHEDTERGRLMPVDGRQDDPYRLSVTRTGGIEVSARLKTVEDVDDLIKALKQNRIMLVLHTETFDCKTNTWSKPAESEQ